MPYRDTSTDWLFFAESDLKTARAVLKEGIPHMVCFHAQQAVEKSLKAILRNRNKNTPKTHSLVKLITEVERLKLTTKMDRNDIYFLDQFYSPTRYPDTLPGSLPEALPKKADAQKSLDIAENIYNLASKIIFP
jgi:HEPN domain-containing protein